MININNRRYIGSKSKLINDIVKSIPSDLLETGFTFADIFSGTGVVAYNMINKASKILVNDILYSNVVIYNCFFSNKDYSLKKIKDIICEFNTINSKELCCNYFSNIYGNKYYSLNDAKKIGEIRERIETLKDSLTEREYFILLTSLIYASDKIANTCGHFESFLKAKPTDTNFLLDVPNLTNVDNCEVFNLDANKLVENIKYDVVYIDPPYNARQYVNFYHVLENLARWNKPTEFEGISMKFKREELKSGYSKSSATKLFQDLIDKIDARLIIVSYNNTYSAKSGASNNKILEEDLINILNKKGKLVTNEVKYKYFNAGKTDLKNHKEIIYVCEVGNYV